MGGREERADLGAGRGVEPAGCGEMVDEEPVSLVGGDASGRRVRLDQVALLLEHRHLVAHRRRRHGDTGRAGDVRRADGLRRRDVFLHDGAEDRRLPFVQHLGNQGYRVLTPASGVLACRRGTGAPRRHRRDRGLGGAGFAGAGLADVPLAARAQRQAVLRRPGSLQHRDVAAGDGPGAARPGPRRQRAGARHRHRLPVPPDAADRALGRRPVRPLRPAAADDHHPGRDGCPGDRARRARPHRRRHDPDRVRDVVGARHHRCDRQPGPPGARNRAASNAGTSRT